jgi:N-acetylneuraminic acid mutarotase
MDVTLPTKVYKGGWLTVGKYVYVIGGKNGSRLNTIFRYDMVNNKVETMSAKLPYNLSQCRLAFDGEDNIYIVGGTNDAGKLVKDVLGYSISNNEVTDFKFDLPYPLANTCISMVNGKLYVLGGDNDTTNTILRLDENGFTSLR